MPTAATPVAARASRGVRGISDEEHQRIYISFEPENAIAKALYESLGFVPDGRVLYGEVVYYLAL